MVFVYLFKTWSNTSEILVSYSAFRCIDNSIDCFDIQKKPAYSTKYVQGRVSSDFFPGIDVIIIIPHFAQIQHYFTKYIPLNVFTCIFKIIQIIRYILKDNFSVEIILLDSLKKYPKNFARNVFQSITIFLTFTKAYSLKSNERLLSKIR